MMERFATGAWLDRPMLRFVACCTVVGTLLAVAAAFVTRTGSLGTLDAWGRPLGTDFTLLWSAGRLALNGAAAAAYDWGLLHVAEKATHASDAVPFFGWHYPPLFLLVAAILASAPYLVSLVLWQLATLGAALLVAYRILPRPETLLAGLGFPAVFVCLAHGHNAFLTAALFGGGLLLLDRRPLLAGMLLGCLAYKPQFGLIVPLALMAGGYWRAVAGAAIAVLLLGGATLAAFGIAPWAAFLATTELTRTVVLEEGGTGWYKIQSVFSFVRMSGGSLPLAYGAQGVCTALVIVATTWLWWARVSRPLRAAALLTGALLATPYVLDYDMVVAGPAIAFLAAHGLQHGFRRWEKTALAALWFVPLATRQLAFFGHVPGGLLAMVAVFGLVVARARDELAVSGTARRRLAPLRAA